VVFLDGAPEAFTALAEPIGAESPTGAGARFLAMCTSLGLKEFLLRFYDRKLK
jgi:hypothetical protein